MSESYDVSLWRNTQPVCPWCSAEYGDAWEINFGPSLEGDTILTCGRCEWEYFCERVVDVYYTTAKPKAKP